MGFISVKFILALAAVVSLSAKPAQGSYYTGSGVCPSGWLKAGSKCYWFSTDAEPWLTATRVCRHKGGQLAIIDSADLLDDVNALRREQGKENRYFWIGASQAHPATQQFVHNTGEVVARELWYEREPNQVTTGDLQCVDIGTSGQDKKMCDWPCTRSVYFLCQRDLLY